MEKYQFEDFKAVIKHSPAFSMARQLPDELLLEREGKLSVYYAPFDYVNPQAKLVIVGITPGLQQAVNALNKAHSGIAEGMETEAILQAAKSFASFSGPMRKNLTAMLDHIGIQRKLGIMSAEELFGRHVELVHFTSVLKNPVFVAGQNYSGNPSMLSAPLLKDCIMRYFVKDVAKLQEAWFVPLGPKVTEALEWLAMQGIIRSDRLLKGMPHPSGANAERIAYFLGKKPKAALSAKTNADAIDAMKSRLLAQLQGIA